VVDVTLTAGASTNVVTIAAAPAVVESETSDRGSVITGKQVTDLPIPQRNFTLLATLSPGVTRPFVTTLGGGGNFEQGGSPGGQIGNGGSTESTRFRESGGSVLVVNGARPTNNSFTLDGADNNEGNFAQIGIYPPPDAIAEFKIQTSVAPAEGGRAGGGITVVLMSFIKDVLRAPLAGQINEIPPTFRIEIRISSAERLAAASSCHASAKVGQFYITAIIGHFSSSTMKVNEMLRPQRQATSVSSVYRQRGCALVTSVSCWERLRVRTTPSLEM
jgi:hypothetical protein